MRISVALLLAGELADLLGDEPGVGGLLRGLGDRRADQRGQRRRGRAAAATASAALLVVLAVLLLLVLGRASEDVDRLALGSTISFSAGIWLEILALGSGGCGCTWPTVRPASRSVFSASACVWPTTFGTSTLPLPTAITIATSESFFAFSPASGVCPITVPGGASVETFCFGAGASARLGLGELLLGLERRLRARDLGDDDVAREQQEEQQREQDQQRQQQRDPPRQPRLLAEDDLVGHQRHLRRRRARAGRLELHQVDVLARHGRLGHARARASRRPLLPTWARGPVTRKRPSRPLASCLPASAAPAVALAALFALGALGQLHVLGGLGLVGLLAGLGEDLDALLLRAPDPLLPRRLDEHLGLDRLARRDLHRRGRELVLELVVGSAASSATVTGALAVFLTATSYWAFLRPDARSGESLVLNSSNGWMPRCSGAAAAWRW